jgi:hypothetical protein
MKQLKIGRNQDNDIVIDDTSVSRHHATIIQTNNSFIVCDNSSSNGTFVNGQRIEDDTVLKQNDKLTLGTVQVPWMNYVSFGENKKSNGTEIIIEEAAKPARVAESGHVQNQNVQQHVIVQQISNTSNENSNGLGVAGFVIGLISFLGSFIVIGGILGIVGLVISCAGLFKSPRGLAIAGLFLSLLSIAIMLVVNS